MANNDYINKVEYGGDTLIDLTSDTVTADTLVEGYTAHTRSGASITGTLSDATQSTHGLMSATDKSHLNSLYTSSFSCSIFKKVCCIGDSLTSGYLYTPYDSAENGSSSYSWVDHMPILTGGEYINLGISGATTIYWLTSNDGLVKMQQSGNKSQAYIIGLGLNDMLSSTTIGTSSDMGAQNSSFYAAFSYLIQSIATINSNAHVFILLPPLCSANSNSTFSAAATTFAPYREAIINCVNIIDTNMWQYHLHLVDLCDYVDLFNRPGCNDSINANHFTEAGYAQVAEIIAKAISDTINAEPLRFSDVHSNTAVTTKFATEAYVQNAISGSGSLPAVTSSDNGKVLRVVNGAWSAVQLPSASGVSF